MVAYPIAIDATGADIQAIGNQAAGSVGLYTDSGHVHPAAGFTVADRGYAAEAYDHLMAVNTGTSRLITAGTLNMIGLRVAAAAAVSKADRYVIGAGAVLTAAQNLIGLYNAAGTLLGSSADQSGVWNTTGFKGATALTQQSAGSLNLTPGLYWLALLGNGTTMPSFSAATLQNVDNRILNGEQANHALFRYCTNGAGLTALPASVTMSGNTAQQVAAWWAGLF
jgi:hypothetical protein